MADKSNSTRPRSLICKLNDTPRGSKTIARHYQKTKDCVVPQLLEWSFLPLISIWNYPGHKKLTTPHLMASELCLCKTVQTLRNVLLSESKQIYLLPIAVSLTEFFFLQWDTKNLCFIRSWDQAVWVLAGLKSQSDTTEWLSIAESLPDRSESQS